MEKLIDPTEEIQNLIDEESNKTDFNASYVHGLSTALSILDKANKQNQNRTVERISSGYMQVKKDGPKEPCLMLDEGLKGYIDKYGNIHHRVWNAWPGYKISVPLDTLFKDPEFTVSTSKGLLKAYPATDPDHPGIYIDLGDEAVALVEQKDQKIRTLAWTKEEEDYVSNTIWNREK